MGSLNNMSRGRGHPGGGGVHPGGGWQHEGGGEHHRGGDEHEAWRGWGGGGWRGGYGLGYPYPYYGYGYGYPYSPWYGLGVGLGSALGALEFSSKAHTESTGSREVSLPLHSAPHAAIYERTLEALSTAGKKTLRKVNRDAFPGDSARALVECGRKKRMPHTGRSFVCKCTIVVVTPDSTGRLLPSELHLEIQPPEGTLLNEGDFRDMFGFLRNLHNRVADLAKEPSNRDPADIYVASTVHDCVRPLKYEFRQIMQPQTTEDSVRRRGANLVIISPFALHTLCKGTPPSLDPVYDGANAGAITDALMTGPRSKLAGLAVAEPSASPVQTPVWQQYIVPPASLDMVCMKTSCCGHARCEKSWSPPPSYIGQQKNNICMNALTCPHGEPCRIGREMLRRMQAGGLCPPGTACIHERCVQDREARVQPDRAVLVLEMNGKADANAGPLSTGVRRIPQPSAALPPDVLEKVNAYLKTEQYYLRTKAKWIALNERMEQNIIALREAWEKRDRQVPGAVNAALANHVGNLEKERAQMTTELDQLRAVLRVFENDLSYGAADLIITDRHVSEVLRTQDRPLYEALTEIVSKVGAYRTYQHDPADDPYNMGASAGAAQPLLTGPRLAPPTGNLTASAQAKVDAYMELARRYDSLEREYPIVRDALNENSSHVMYYQDRSRNPNLSEEERLAANTMYDKIQTEGMEFARRYRAIPRELDDAAYQLHYDAMMLRSDRDIVANAGAAFNHALQLIGIEGYKKYRDTPEPGREVASGNTFAGASFFEIGDRLRAALPTGPKRLAEDDEMYNPSAKRFKPVEDDESRGLSAKKSKSSAIKSQGAVDLNELYEYELEEAARAISPAIAKLQSMREALTRRQDIAAFNANATQTAKEFLDIGKFAAILMRLDKNAYDALVFMRDNGYDSYSLRAKLALANGTKGLTFFTGDDKLDAALPTAAQAKTTTAAAPLGTACDSCGKHSTKKKKHNEYAIMPTSGYAHKGMQTMMASRHLATLAKNAPGCTPGDVLAVNMAACQKMIPEATGTKMTIVPGQKYQAFADASAAAVKTGAKPTVPLWAAGKCIAMGTVDHAGSIVAYGPVGTSLDAGKNNFVVFSDQARSSAGCDCEGCR